MTLIADPQFWMTAAIFTLLAIASGQIGKYITRWRLPLISGYILAGIVMGPYVLKLLDAQAVVDLRIVDEMALAFIAFSAGTHLYLPDIRHHIKSIGWITLSIAVGVPVAGTATIYLLSDMIPFMADMPGSHRLAIAVLAGAILVARSPSSVIAIVNELRAKGPMTQTILSVTMIADVVVIVLFAINSSIADALFTNLSLNLGFAGLLVVELSLSIGLGVLIGYLLRIIFSRGGSTGVRTILILIVGLGVFYLSGWIREMTHEFTGIELLLEPLLICMVAGFHLANTTIYRAEFLNLQAKAGPSIYVAFFTLTGIGLELDVLTKTWFIAIILFFVRIFAIFVSATFGGFVAQATPNMKKFGWMGFITQAGIGLGLAREVSVEFPEWGVAFATLMIAVIVLNQLLGPPFTKWALQHVGEARHRPKGPEYEGIHRAVIFGFEDQSLALARQLDLHGWQVKIATRAAESIEGAADADVEITKCEGFTVDAMAALDLEHTDGVVCLLDDEENLKLCKVIDEYYGTPILVVRLNDRSLFDRFHEYGALIVDPGSAMVSLMDHLVRSPVATSIMLGMERGKDVLDIEVRDPDYHGKAIRDLRLPLDTVILSVRRGDQILVSHGFTRLNVGDKISVVGPRESLKKVELMFDR